LAGAFTPVPSRLTQNGGLGNLILEYSPYEVLVNGGVVEALPMRFRMAVHFPDLSMMGKHGFTKLMSSPRTTEKALEPVVSGNEFYWPPFARHFRERLPIT
jgi:hypothetical protein